RVTSVQRITSILVFGLARVKATELERVLAVRNRQVVPQGVTGIVYVLRADEREIRGGSAKGKAGQGSLKRARKKFRRRKAGSIRAQTGAGEVGKDRVECVVEGYFVNDSRGDNGLEADNKILARSRRVLSSYERIERSGRVAENERI